MTIPLWYKNAVFYQIYVRAYKDDLGTGFGNIRGLSSKIGYLKELGVDCIWLMPIYPSPLRDDGYDISDFCNVNPQFGTLEDFQALVKSVHENGIRIIMDLVINHTSDEHPWFKIARSDKNSPYREYYVWSDSADRYRDARIIFLDTEESNWTWDTEAGQYYWHRFYSSQPDLNYDNPAVRQEILKVMKFWLDMDVDGFRVDAVPYLFEREGTNCENLSETHDFLKEMRHFLEENYQDRILLCEANQWPEDVRDYFGDGDEFHMAFHFPLMPRIFMALKQHDFSPIQWALQKTPNIPKNSQWCIFLRNHDELTLEMVTGSERQWMWDAYAPDPKMRINLGIRRRLAPLLGNNKDLIGLANSLLFTLPGSPVIYYGDEIGMGDNIDLQDRNGVRTPMQWDATPGAGFSTAEILYAPIISDAPFSPEFVNVKDEQNNEYSLWQIIHKMILARKQHPVFGSGSFRLINCGKPAVFCFERSGLEEKFLLINNLSPEGQKVKVLLESDCQRLIDVLSGMSFPLHQQELTFHLERYQFLWLKME